MTRQGPVLIAYDGSPSSRHAVQEAGLLLSANPALVLTVWKRGLAFELLQPPAAPLGLPPAPLDIRSALEFDRELYEAAQRSAEGGAQLAREVGFAEAEPLVVAEEPDVPVAQTIISVADERDARAIVVGAHAHGRLDEIILGSTSREVIRRAEQPVLVAPEPRRNKKASEDVQAERTAARG
jgi:nucleotide-binding universal stress UspA family protein